MCKKTWVKNQTTNGKKTWSLKESPAKPAPSASESDPPLDNSAPSTKSDPAPEAPAGEDILDAEVGEVHKQVDF